MMVHLAIIPLFLHPKLDIQQQGELNFHVRNRSVRHINGMQKYLSIKKCSLKQACQTQNILRRPPVDLCATKVEHVK